MFETGSDFLADFISNLLSKLKSFIRIKIARRKKIEKII